MQFKVKNRWTGEIQFTAEIELGEIADESVAMGCAVKWAYANKLDLADADLRNAYLRDAQLFGIHLRGADLSGACLRNAYLRGACLREASLKDADLHKAFLMGADLTDVEFGPGQLRAAKHDLWGLLLHYRAEAPAVLEKLRLGRIEGDGYQNICANLMGTLATMRGKNMEDLPEFDPVNSAAEDWFSRIHEGDTPENHAAAQKAAEWIEEFISLTAPD